MNSYEMAAAITAVAISIANQLSDDELEVAASAFVQLGDTLATIATQRSLCNGSPSGPTRVGTRLVDSNLH